MTHVVQERLTEAEAKKQQERRDYFDAHAAGWEERGYPAVVRERLAELVSTFELKPAEKVLDVGCGEGVLVPYLLEKIGKDGFIVELDNSLEMLKGAKKKSARQIQCVWAGIEAAPLVDEDFDRVICFASFPHFASYKKALKEIHRVLKPEGTLVIAHLMSRDQIACHHAKCSVVLGDELPSESKLRELLSQTGFALQSLTDCPGRYLALAKKVKSDEFAA